VDPAPRLADTLSVWVVARLLEDPGTASGSPLTTFAADSVLRVLRFAPLGTVPKTDTAPDAASAVTLAVIVVFHPPRR
jgi:hypothetical protein